MTDIVKYSASASASGSVSSNGEAMSSVDNGGDVTKGDEILSFARNDRDGASAFGACMPGIRGNLERDRSSLSTLVTEFLKVGERKTRKVRELGAALVTLKELPGRVESARGGSRVSEFDAGSQSEKGPASVSLIDYIKSEIDYLCSQPTLADSQTFRRRWLVASKVEVAQ